MNTGTPRTDAAVIGSLHRPPMANFDGGYVAVVSADFARQLERELNGQKEINRLEQEHRLAVESVRDELQKNCDQLRADLEGERKAHVEVVHEAEQLRAEVERLKTELLSYGHRASETSIEFNDIRQERDQWREDAERLAFQLGVYRAYHSVADDDALAAHERLVKEAKK